MQAGTSNACFSTLSGVWVNVWVDVTKADHAHILYSQILARQLWQAEWDEDTNKLQSLLDQGADPNHEVFWSEEWIYVSRDDQASKLRNRLPPLHVACKYGELERVKVLVQGGADTEKGDAILNLTPLQQAIFGGQEQVVEYLTKEVKCKIGE